MKSKIPASVCAMSSCGAEIKRGDSILYFPPPWQEDRAAWLDKTTRARGFAWCEECGRDAQEGPQREETAPAYAEAVNSW